MDPEFKKCIESKKIVPFAAGRKLVDKELSVAQGDLSEAKAGYANGRYKWSTVQAYYAMFHAARALVYSQGYREKSHYCLAVALRALLVDTRKLDAQSVRDLLNAMNLRESADYDAEFSQSGAKAVIESAERLIKKAVEILTIH